MKQTNNAIKFLMAQYRAIFQNAYFKGLATAAVVTMGLAAGQAQATTTDAVLEVGDSVTVTPKTITINGTASADGTTTGVFKNVSVVNGTLDLSEFTMNITGEENAGTSNKVTGTGGAGTLKVNTLSIKAGAETKGLLVEGIAGGGANLTATNINIKEGVLATKGATNAGVVNANTLTVGGADTATADHAVLKIEGLGTVGYALDGDGSKATDGEIKDVANYTTVNLDKNSKLSATASADTTILHAASLTINGGKIDVAAASSGPNATDSLTINLAQGELKDGEIKTVTNGVLNVNFTDKDFVKSGDSVEKTLTLTKGKLNLGGELTLSGEGKLVISNLDALTFEGDKGVTLSGGASFAPANIAQANALAKMTPLSIAKGGILDFGNTLDLTNSQNSVKFGAVNKTDGTIGLVAGGIVKAKDTTLDKDLVDAAAVAQADTITLKNPSQAYKVAFEHTVLSANKALILDSSDVTVKGTAKIVLGEESAKTIAASEAYKKVGITDEDKKALLLGHAGSINSTHGSLTITSGGSMTVANGTWTSNADIVLAKDNGTAGILNVGLDDADSAAKLSLGSKKLTLTEGTINVGADSTSPLSAELDLSEADITLTKGSLNIKENGLVKLNADNANKFLANDQVLTLIDSGATLVVDGDLEISGDNDIKTDGTSKGAFNFSGDTGKLSTLEVTGTLTIEEGARATTVGEHGKIVVNQLVLNKGTGATAADVSLDAGHYEVAKLTSDNTGKSLTLKAKSDLGTVSK